MYHGVYRNKTTGIFEEYVSTRRRSCVCLQLLLNIIKFIFRVELMCCFWRVTFVIYKKGGCMYKGWGYNYGNPPGSALNAYSFIYTPFANKYTPSFYSIGSIFFKWTCTTSSSLTPMVPGDTGMIVNTASTEITVC